MQDYLFPVELIIDHHVEVVFFLRNINGHIDALPEHLYGNGVAVVLVVHEEGEFLTDGAQFEGHESEIDTNLGITLDIIGTLELDLREELFKRVCLEQGRSQAGGLLGLKTDPLLLWQAFLVEIKVFLGGSVIAVLDLLLVHYRRIVLEYAVVPCVDLLYLLSQLLLVNERDTPTILCLHKHPRWKGTFILDANLPKSLLAENYLAEVHFGLFRALQVDEGFFTGTHQGDIDRTRFTQQG